MSACLCEGAGTESLNSCCWTPLISSILPPCEQRNMQGEWTGLQSQRVPAFYVREACWSACPSPNGAVKTASSSIFSIYDPWFGCHNSLKTTSWLKENWLCPGLTNTVLATYSNDTIETTVKHTAVFWPQADDVIYWVGGFPLASSIDASWRHFVARLPVSDIIKETKESSGICDVTTYVSVMQWSCRLK